MYALMVCVIVCSVFLLGVRRNGYAIARKDVFDYRKTHRMCTRIIHKVYADLSAVSMVHYGLGQRVTHYLDKHYSPLTQVT